MPTNQLDYLINHIFIPPRLPQACDLNTMHEHALCAFMKDCTDRFLAMFPSSDQKATWKPGFYFLRHLCELYRHDALSANIVKDMLEKLVAGGTSIDCKSIYKSSLLTDCG